MLLSNQISYAFIFLLCKCFCLKQGTAWKNPDKHMCLSGPCHISLVQDIASLNFLGLKILAYKVCAYAHESKSKFTLKDICRCSLAHERVAFITFPQACSQILFLSRCISLGFTRA